MSTLPPPDRQSTTTTNEGQILERFKTILDKSNKRKIEPLTAAKLRERSGLEHLSDEEASEAIDSIKNLAAIFFEIACHKEGKDNDEQDSKIS